MVHRDVNMEVGRVYCVLDNIAYIAFEKFPSLVVVFQLHSAS